MTRLTVLMDGRVAGTIDDSDNTGPAMFSYAEGYNATPLSVSAQDVRRRFDATHWIDGLLADNDAVRERWRSDYGAPSARPIDLLATAIGWDCAGAVQFCRPEHLDALTVRGGSLSPLTESQVARIIARLRSDFTAWSSGPAAAAFSLAGAQSKTALRYSEGRWYRPFGDAATTHILKPAPSQWPDLDIVEHLSCAAAANLGLPTAKTECSYIGDERVLIVTRYDRRPAPNGEIARVHQEDLCQALDVSPERKYQNMGGPTPAEIASLLRAHSTQPDEDVERFRDALIYSWLIAGTDAHAKNYSLMLAGNQVRLAPLYDVCSFLPYRGDGPVGKIPLAMRIGRDYRITKADRANAWKRTAEAMEMLPGETLERVADLAGRLPDALAAAIDRLPDNLRTSLVAALLAREIKTRSQQCASMAAAATKSP